MSLKHTLLGFLAYGAMTGYDLKKNMDSSTQFFWHAGLSQIYPALKRVLDVDTVVFCIGDKVDEKFGLPVQWNEFVKSSEPRFPVNDVSYESYDPDAGAPIEGVFVAGWSREASSGLVGVARKDGESGAKAMLGYLGTVEPLGDHQRVTAALDERLRANEIRVISKVDIEQLNAFEQSKAERLGLEEFKLGTNEEMLAVIAERTPA